MTALPPLLLLLLLLLPHLVGYVWVSAQLQQQRHHAVMLVLNSQVQRRKPNLCTAIYNSTAASGRNTQQGKTAGYA
jgi:hypothetical protein